MLLGLVYIFVTHLPLTLKPPYIALGAFDRKALWAAEQLGRAFSLLHHSIHSPNFNSINFTLLKGNGRSIKVRLSFFLTFK